MRFASLGSGSSGNATVVEVGETRVMLDCGFPAAEIVARLARLGLAPEHIDAVIITHEHTDHIGGAASFARRFSVPVWLTFGTHSVWRRMVSRLPQVSLFAADEAFSVGDVLVQSYTVPHDAREPVQFVFSDGCRRLGILTDVGCSTPHIESMLSGCEALMLECNHDTEMLQRGPYPPRLKHRVGGNFGHLANDAAAALLERLDRSRLQHVIAAHLSEKNNRPELARQALARVLGCDEEWVGVAEQEAGLAWRTLA